jgi:hypothetical protein
VLYASTPSLKTIFVKSYPNPEELCLMGHKAV